MSQYEQGQNQGRDICGSANLTNHENKASDETSGEGVRGARTATNIVRRYKTENERVICSDFPGSKCTGTTKWH